MNLQEAWQHGSRLLDAVGIPDASLESEILLRHAMGLSRAALFSRWGEPVLALWLRRFRSYLRRRLRREPTAYILKQREFYGLDFFVDRRVLIPRPETELLVEKAVALVGGRPLRVVDVGTGCGAVAIALAHHLPRARIWATDVSPLALQVARRNRRRYRLGHRLRLLEGDLLSPLPGPADLIVANLPYVRDGDIAGLPPEVRDYEPLSALSGGPDGLDAVRRLGHQAPLHLRRGGWLLFEVGQGQAEAASALARQALGGGPVEVAADPAGIPRLVMAQRA
ncbi:MAG: peptide chain release factor N(5)-glutamine methyltransferase [Dehalococcoidia bacterium]